MKRRDGQKEGGSEGGSEEYLGFICITGILSSVLSHQSEELYSWTNTDTPSALGMRLFSGRLNNLIPVEYTHIFRCQALFVMYSIVIRITSQK